MEYFNSILWLIITMLFMLSSLIVNKLFKSNDKRIDVQEKEQEKIKMIKYKTLDEQKKYLQNKADLGKDFIYMVLNLMIFFLVFRLLIYPRIPNLLIGVISSIIFAAVFAYITAEYVYPKKYFAKNFVNTLMSISFMGSFLSYMKFVDTIHPLIMLALMIILMVGISWVWKKCVK